MRFTILNFGLGTLKKLPSLSELAVFPHHSSHPHRDGGKLEISIAAAGGGSGFRGTLPSTLLLKFVKSGPFPLSLLRFSTSFVCSCGQAGGQAALAEGKRSL